MQSSLKKSLYLGLAAVSFAAVAGTSVNASAKSYAKLTAPSTVLTTAANTRNVNLTGTTSATSNTLFYQEPAYTNYKIGRAKVNGAVLAKTDAYKGAKFTFSKAVTTSREGDTWYQIASTTLANGTKSSDLNGAWVKASNVNNPAADPTATKDNSIKVVYQLSNKNSISGADKTFVAGSTTKTTENAPYSNEKNNAGQDIESFAKANVPDGYVVIGHSTDAVYGGTYVATVAQAATSKVDLYYNDGTANVVAPFTISTSNKLALTPTQQKDNLFGATGDNVDVAKVAGLFSDQKLYASTPIESGADKGKVQTYTVSTDLTSHANSNVKFGQNVKLVLVKGAVVDASTVSGAKPSETANSDFLN